ncbi:MAG: LysE/ArgO family amino acid transporter, partial [Micrococcales bacterium]
VYLDTVLFLGTIGAQFGDQRWLFGAGAATASVVWFATIGFGARAASKVMSKPVFWRILDVFIGVVMTLIAISLAFADFS